MRSFYEKYFNGVSRSGKTTLAKKLKNENNYSYIPLDYFISSLKRNFPSTNIKSNVVIDRESSKNLALFLSRVIEIMNYTNEKYIIDSAHLYLEDIMKYIDLDKWNVYCLGYPNTTKEEKLKQIRKFDSIKDWTYNKTDEELLNILKKLINISKELEKESNKYNIKFIDTSNS